MVREVRRMADRKLLRDTLEQYFGYRNFRPFQEEIVTDLIEGHDVLAIIATGGENPCATSFLPLCREGSRLSYRP
jgi:ATP-dependent DNA helicase RecQ